MMENDGITVSQVFTCGLPLVSWSVGASQPGRVDIVLSFVMEGELFLFIPCDYFPALLLLKL
jgi:hypothetical protein